MLGAGRLLVGVVGQVEDSQIRLGLAYFFDKSRFRIDIDHEQIDTHSPRNIEHLQRILGHEHAIANVAHGLFNELLHCRALFDDNDRREGSDRHAANVARMPARDQTQMG